MGNHAFENTDLHEETVDDTPQAVPVSNEDGFNAKEYLALNNRVYDFLKWLTMFLLPASATLYFTLAGLWGWPNAEKVLGTISGIEIFLGVILGLSNRAYKKSGAAYDGTITQDLTREDVDAYSIDIKSSLPEVVAKQDTVTLKVQTLD